jgi:hypothetical protein
MRSHALPLKVCEYVTEATKTKITLISVEPKTAYFGEGLTSDVKILTQKL